MTIKLPMYERQVREGQLNAPSAQVVNASVGPGLSALGQGIQHLGAGIEHYQTQVAKADGVRVDVVKSQIAAGKQHMLEGQENGFLTTQNGQDAIKSSDGYKKQFEAYVKTLVADLTPAQQEQLKPAMINELTSFGHVVDQHVAKQTAIIDQDATQSILTGKASEAASAAVRGDWDTMHEAFGAGLGQLDKANDRAGVRDVAVRKAKEQEYLSGARIGVLETLLGSDQPGMAAQFLHEWGPELNQSDLAKSKLRDRIDGAVVKSQADDIAAAAWAKSNDDPQAADEAIAKDTTLDPRVRDLATALVRKRADAYAADIKKADGEGLSRLIEEVAARRGSFTLTELYSHPEMKAFRGQDAKTKAVQAVNAEARRWSSDADVRQYQSDIDAAAIADFRDKAANDPDAALQIDPTDYTGTTKRAQSQIGELRGKLGTAQGKKDAIDLGEFRDWVRSKLPRVSKELRPNVLSAMTEEYERYKSAHGGKPMPRSEADKLITDNFLDGEAEHFFGNKKRTKIEAQLRGETFIPGKGSAPASAPQAAQPDNVYMRAPPTAEFPKGQLLYVPRNKVKEFEDRGAKVIGGK